MVTILVSDMSSDIVFVFEDCMSINTGIYGGNLVRDPELRRTPNGVAVVKFDIAVNRTFKRGTERAKETAFLPCEAWDKGAEVIAEHFKKGDYITVNTSVKQENWEDKATGGKRSKLVFRVNEFHFPPSGNSNRAPKAEAAVGSEAGGEFPTGDGAGGEDNIPF